MGESLEAVAKIRHEIDEYQISIVFANSCLKTKKRLIQRLNQQCQQQKQEYNFLNNTYKKNEMQYKVDETKLKSLNLALDSLNSANTELGKELRLLKERRLEIEERVRNGIKKYEDQWTSAKEKYEHISIIIEHKAIKNNILSVQENIDFFIDNSKKLIAKINNKRREVEVHDQNRIIELAHFFVIYKPKLLKSIAEKENQKNNLINNIENTLKRHKIDEIKINLDKPETPDTFKVPDVPARAKPSLVLPSIQLQSMDLDLMSVKLDEIKKTETTKKIDTGNPPNVNEPVKTIASKQLTHTSISYYFNIYGITRDEKENDYSNKKLINILDDVKLNANETHEIISKINPANLQDVHVIKGGEKEKIKEISQEKNSQKSQPIVSQEIEEVDLTGRNSPINLLPPTQFMDMDNEKTVFKKSSLTPSSDDKSNKLSQEKKVSFNLKQVEEMQVDDASHDTSVASDDSYSQMRDKMLRKYNLDSSPQFTYTKNVIKTVPTKPKSDDIVTSKFFEVKDQENNTAVEMMECEENNKITDNKQIEKDQKELPVSDSINIKNSSATPKTKAKTGGTNQIVSGLLFNHDQEGIESLDLSEVTEYDGDIDYPQGIIDSSLLMSPKADDVPMTNKEDNCASQELPNFLAGMRKPGFAFFGKSNGDTPESSSGNQGNPNFTFSFGGGQKKKGGLFSMFY